MEYTCAAENEVSACTVGTVNQCLTVIDLRSSAEESPQADKLSGSDTDHELVSHKSKRINYSLKIAHRLHPGGLLEKFEGRTYDSYDEVKEKITGILEAKGLATDSEELNFGYILPGHGLKGKQQPINDDSDVAMTYNSYCTTKSPIVVWAKLSQKRLVEIYDANSNAKTKKTKTGEMGASTSSAKNTSGTTYKSHANKMAEVDSIVEKLEEKHSGGTFTPEQLRAWAHMIQLNKHVSFDQPPDKPFFRSSSKKPESSQGISPAKRINLRSECIDQLDKWHKLMERGAISSEQYEELQCTIMNIKKF